MGHSHYHRQGHNHGAASNIKVAFFLNLGFTVIEIIGGIYTNSLAILSDALHDLGDSFSLGLAWYFEKISQKGRDQRFSYGYRRFSLLGAIINSVVLITGSILILSVAIPQLFDPAATNVEGMIVLAFFGVLVNGAAAFRLSRGSTLNEKAVAMHLLEDVMGWVAVLIGAVVMYFFDLPIIDPLLSILISLFIIYNVIKNLKKSFHIILQGTPENLDVDSLEQKLQSIAEVMEIHDCHAWTLDGQYNVLSLHLVLDKDYSLTEQAVIKSKVRELLAEDSVTHLTVEFECKDEHCEMREC